MQAHVCLLERLKQKKIDSSSACVPWLAKKKVKSNLYSQANTSQALWKYCTRRKLCFLLYWPCFSIIVCWNHRLRHLSEKGDCWKHRCSRNYDYCELIQWINSVTEYYVKVVFFSTKNSQMKHAQLWLPQTRTVWGFSSWRTLFDAQGRFPKRKSVVLQAIVVSLCIRGSKRSYVRATFTGNKSALDGSSTVSFEAILSSALILSDLFSLHPKWFFSFLSWWQHNFEREQREENFWRTAGRWCTKVTKRFRRRKSSTIRHVLLESIWVAFVDVSVLIGLLEIERGELGETAENEGEREAYLVKTYV